MRLREKTTTDDGGCARLQEEALAVGDFSERLAQIADLRRCGCEQAAGRVIWLRNAALRAHSGAAAAQPGIPRELRTSPAKMSGGQRCSSATAEASAVLSL
jgi:hypothetical protein